MPRRDNKRGSALAPTPQWRGGEGTGRRRRAYSERGSEGATCCDCGKGSLALAPPCCQRTAVLINQQEIPGYWGHSILRGPLSLLSPYFPVGEDGEQTQWRKSKKQTWVGGLGKLGCCSVVGSFQNSLSTKSVPLPLSTQCVPLVLSRQGVTLVSREGVTLVSTQCVAFSAQSSLLARPQALLLPPPHAVSPRWIKHLHTDPLVSMVGSFSALAALTLLVSREGFEPTPN